jgi:hypothetical protein
MVSSISIGKNKQKRERKESFCGSSRCALMKYFRPAGITNGSFIVRFFHQTQKNPLMSYFPAPGYQQYCPGAQLFSADDPRHIFKDWRSYSGPFNFLRNTKIGLQLVEAGTWLIKDPAMT